MLLKRIQNYPIVALVVSTVLMIYLVLRAIYVPVMHDEVMTFFHYVHKGDILPGEAHWDANNHIINTALSTIFYKLFGHSLLVLRLSSLLAFPVFAWFAYRICSVLRTQQLSILAFTALVSARFTLEFFALARGYGLAMAFMLGAIFYLGRYFNDRSHRNFALGLFFLSATFLANLSFFNTATLVFGLIALDLLLIAKISTWNPRHWMLLIIFGILPWCYGLWYAFALKERGALYYGTLDGFVNVTLNSLLKWQFGSTALWLQTVTIGVFLFSIGIFLYYRIKNLKEKIDLPFLLAFLLLGNWILILLMAKVLKVNYPEDRAGIYFIPLLILGFAFAIDRISLKSVKLAHLGWLFLVFPVMTAFNANFRHFEMWHSQTLPVSFSQRMKKEVKESDYLQGYPLCIIPWNYYHLSDTSTIQMMHFQNYPSQVPEWQVIYTKDAAKFEANYELIEQDSYNEMSLVRRKKPMVRTQIWQTNPVSTSGVIQEEFFSIFEKTEGEVPEKMGFELEFTLNSPSIPITAQVVFSVDDSTGKNVIYDYVPVCWLKTNWNGQRYKMHRFLEHIPKKPKRLVVYLWNIKKQPFEMKDCSLKIYSLNENP